MKKTKTLFLPFSPGIPWQVRNGKYIVPELPVSLFHSALKDKRIVVAGFGELAESFHSLSILETVNDLMPELKLFWCGDEKYSHLVKANGLAKVFDGITQFDLDRFPTPIFFDKNKRAYFNYLNNYLNVNAYYLTPGYRDKRPMVQQLVEKSTATWKAQYLPRLRHFSEPDGLDHYLKMYKIHVNGPYALMFPDGEQFSQHDVDCLNWDIHQIRSTAAILSQHSIPLIILTNNTSRFTYSQAKVLPLRLDFATYLIKKSSVVLSKTIDFLLVANAISDAKLVSVAHKNEYDLNKNNVFLDDNNVLYTREHLLSVEVCNFITER